MSKNLMAHESAVASTKMFLQMLLISFVLSVIIHFSMIIFTMYPKIKRVKERPLPYSTRTLSNSTILNYYTNFGFNIGELTPIPTEFSGLFKHNTILSSLVVRGNLIRREKLKSFMDSYYKNFFRRLPSMFVKTFTGSLYVYLFIPFYILYFYFRSRGVKNDIFLRGTKIINNEDMEKQMKNRCLGENLSPDLENNYRIGKIILPREAEQKHILILGSTGTGKTVLANQIISQSVSRQKRPGVSEKSIIYDIKGELLSKHFNPSEDIIFYPFDSRCVGWSFMNEIKNYSDFDVLSSILFEPPKDSKDPYWYNAARDIFRAGLLCLYMNSGTGKPPVVKNGDIMRFFSMTPEKFRNVLYNSLPPNETGALKHIESSQSPQSSGVLSVLQERISFFKYLCDSDGDFSFRDFISRSGNRNLFLLNIKQNDSIFKPLMTFVIDVMIKETLSMEDISSPDERRINFFIDEFGSLAKLPSVFDFLTMARAKGGSLTVINQDLGSVSDIYGKDKKETFFNNFNTDFIFMLNDPTTAEFLSKAFGEQEIIQKSGDRQISPNSLGDTYTHREQFKINRVVLPSEFINLKPFQCYFKHSGTGFTKMDIRKIFLPSTYPQFIEKKNTLKKLRHGLSGKTDVNSDTEGIFTL